MDVLTFADGALELVPDRIARIVINAPARKNAISRRMWAAFPMLCDRIAQDDGIRVVLLTAAGGPGVFSAGADISEFDEVYANPKKTRAYNDAVRLAQARLQSLPRPMIAVINGACVGGGCGLVLAADLRFASSEARFAITPACLGLAYSPADTAQLVEKIGPSRAKDMLFSGRFITATEALSWGLIDRMIPADALELEVLRYASDLAELSAVTHRSAKAIVNGLTPPPTNAALQAIYEASFLSDDFREGQRAFHERRKPFFE